MKRSVLVSTLACATLLAASIAPAAGSKPRLHLERVVPGEGALKLYASAVELEGTLVDDLAPPQFTLLVDGKPAGRPAKGVPFEATAEEVDAVFVVEIAAQYKKDLEPLKAALKDLLDEPPRKLRAQLVSFSSDFDLSPGFQAPAALEDAIDQLEADDDSVDLRMADALNAALLSLKKRGADEPGGVAPRRLIVLVSDGLNVKMDRATFRGLGERAAQSGIAIHTIAFSPTDDRGPLLNLGELSKRSHGTFRWAQKAGDLKPQLASLAAEIKGQYVLTFPSRIESPAGHVFRLRAGELESNPLGGASASATARPGFFAAHATLLEGIGAAIALGLLGLVVVAVLRARAARPPQAKRVRAPRPVAATGPVKAPAKPVSREPALATAAAGGVATAHAARSVTLIAIGGALAGQRVPVRGAVTIGKALGHSLQIVDDPSVSSRHCEIAFDGAQAHVRDLGSTNGTFVNNARVPGAQRLVDGDVLRLGAQTQFKVRID